MIEAVADLSALPITMQPVQPERHVRPYVAQLYIAAFLVTVSVMVVGLLLLGRTDWFLVHSRYSGLRGVGYSQRAGRQNCEIVIYGDSSAMAALDPAIIQQATGLKTCNIAEGTPIQQVVGTDPPLQRYLAQNPAPRVLLTSWTPSFLKPDQQPLYEYHIEGMWYAWRYGMGSKLHSWTTVEWTAKYVTWEVKALLDGLRDGVLGINTRGVDVRRLREQRNGQWPFPLPPQTHCVRAYNLYPVQRWEENVKSFRQKYATPFTRVIVDISPIPDCDPMYKAYAHISGGLYDNVLQRLPISDFNDHDVHLDLTGSRIFSEEAAEQVLAALREQQSQTQRRSVSAAKTESKGR